MGKSRFFVWWIIAAFAVSVPAVLAAQEADPADPFYESLLDEARFLYKEGKPAETIENLEVAFFGFLDHPGRLFECYVYLGVCHYQQKNYEKAAYYIQEIRRLKLGEHDAGAALPEGLAAKYAEVSAKLVES